MLLKQNLVSDDQVAVGLLSGDIVLVSLNGTVTQRIVNAHAAGVEYMVKLSNGNIFSCSDDNTVKYWNMTIDSALNDGYYQATLITTLTDTISSVKTLELLNNETLLASGSDNGQIIIWDVATLTVQLRVNTTEAVATLKQITSMYMANGLSSGAIQILDILTGVCVHTLLGHSSTVYYIDLISADMFASASDDTNINLWSTNASFALIRTLYGHTSVVYVVSIMNMLEKKLTLYTGLVFKYDKKYLQTVSV